MSEHETITPIEYVEGNYNQRSDIIVWHGSFIVYNVGWFEESTYVRRGYNVLYNGADNRYQHVDTYDHCLRIEPLDCAAFRARLHSYIDQLPDIQLVEVLEELQIIYELGD